VSTFDLKDKTKLLNQLNHNIFSTDKANEGALKIAKIYNTNNIKIYKNNFLIIYDK
jgi:hypothetical protein